MTRARSAFVLLLLVGCSFGANFISNALGDNMVLQRGQKARLWGWTKPGSQVKATISGEQKSYSSIADKTGLWIIHLDEHTGSFEPKNITLGSTAGETRTLTNVLFGDVYVCSGQSNMQFSVAAAFNASEEIARAKNYPFIRLFTVGTQTTSLEPLDEFRTFIQPWQQASAASVGNGPWSYFSATCWFYATHLAEQVKVPLGLVSSNWGGTPVQAWSSKDALAKCHQPEDDVTIEADPSPGTPSVLYNAMIVPLLNMRVKGAIWYQGEANAGQATYYACQFPAMIADWRIKFGYENPRDFTFFFVQLAPWEPAPNDALGAIREAQLAALKLPYVGFATAADLGDTGSPEGNIHPRNKEEVGRRLALSSEAITYGLPVKWRGPTYSSHSQSSQTSVVIHFDPATVGSAGLVHKSFTCPVNAMYCLGFEVNTGKTWEKAEVASVSGYTATLRYQTAGTVAHVRYGWSAWPSLTLYNKENLPAPPFTTEAI